ncbi:MAG: hypothetical protein FWF97_02700 [Alphaproteobacteria bacterium]|nr:hypothetical protein [Alphaproteobacteria bacterium]
MKSIVIALLAAVLVALGAYWSGGRVGAEKCRAEISEISSASTTAMQEEITETKGQINAEVFNTGAADIRDRLRKYWTIKD